MEICDGTSKIYHRSDCPGFVRVSVANRVELADEAAARVNEAAAVLAASSGKIFRQAEGSRMYAVAP